MGKLNIDENDGIRRRHGVRSVPTLLVFERGEVVDRSAGAVSKASIESLRDRHRAPVERAAAR